MSASPAALRSQLRDRDGDECWLCCKPIDFSKAPCTPQGPTIDHVKPRAAGGSSKLSNLRLAHNTCNHVRGSRYDGADYGNLPSPYGVGKHYRRPSQRRYGTGVPGDGSDWDTPVTDCWPLFESWSAAHT